MYITAIKRRISHRCVGTLSPLLPHGGEGASSIPSLVSGTWHTCMHKIHIFLKTNTTHTEGGRQQDLNLGLHSDASHALTKLLEEGSLCRGGGQRDRHRAHFSHSSWLSRSGGKERCDCFSSCSLWSRTRLSQWEKRISSKHLWWQGHSPAFKMTVHNILKW